MNNLSPAQKLHLAQMQAQQEVYNTVTAKTWEELSEREQSVYEAMVAKLKSYKPQPYDPFDL